MASNFNPLTGWAGQSGVNQPGTNPLPPVASQPLASGNNLNPYGFGVRGGGNLTANLAENNLQTGIQRNALIPQYAQQMFGMGGNAAQFFHTLMNLGSPYYQQAQRSVFEQGNQQNQNAAAQARQQLGAAGYGYTPSGAMAGMFGGMAQGGAQSLAQNYLQQLFNNQQLQAQGAQGLAGLAQLFNPAQLTGQQTNPAIQQPTNTLAQDLGAVGQLAGSIFGGGGAGLPH